MAARITKEVFLARARDKFGDKFEYDLATYKNLRRSKIKVFCTVKDHFNDPHGWFSITPYLHLRGSGGCDECSWTGKYRLRNKRDFIYFSKLIHGEKYDYTDFAFVERKTKGWLKCDIKDHPSFLVDPNSHLSRKSGCPECGRISSGRLGSISRHQGETYLQKFLREAPKVHKNKFDYSEVKKLSELRTKDYITVICPNHGPQSVQPAVHLNGHDCYQCAVDLNADNKRKDQSIFIKECQEKWGYSDDFYSLVNYKGKAYKIILKCPVHGPFPSNAGSHLLRGYGCAICSGNTKKTREEIIQLSIQKHGDKYDYSEVEKEIENVHQKITLICKLHKRLFRTTAVGHYNMGYGCPECGQLKSGVDNIKVFMNNSVRANSYCELYLVGIGEYFKIGISEDTYKRDKKYEEFYLIEPSTRAICWCAEQYLLINTQWMEPSTLPEKFVNWSGRQELRLSFIEPLELAELMQVILAECKKLGWQKFASKYSLPDYGYGWDPESANYEK